MKLLKTQKHQSYITITVLILMLVLVSITYLLADILLSELTIARNNKAALGAFSLAEAGVQEAIYQVQYDPTIRGKFLANDDSIPPITHDPALLNNGAYTYTIAIIDNGAATITSTGTYSIGTLRSAKREITVDITENTGQPPYTDDGAFYSYPVGENQSTGDLEFSSATVNVYNGSIHSGRSIQFKDSTIQAEKGIKAETNITNPSDDSVIDCNCQIVDDGDPETPQCSEHPPCTFTYEPSTYMPTIDIDTSSNSYKNQAKASSQYFTSQSAFFAYYFPSGVTTATASGVVFIEDSKGLTFNDNRTLNMNGVLIVTGTIEIGTGSKNGKIGIINLARPDGPSGIKPAGLLSKDGNIYLNQKGNLTGTGLIYAGNRIYIYDSPDPMTFTGGLLAHLIYFNARTVNLYFDVDIINHTLGTPQGSPVIKINHWEEEY